MSKNRIFIAGRGATCTFLQVPTEHLEFWKSLDEDQLGQMARCLQDSEKQDLPDGIDAPLAVWGEGPWNVISGPDAAEEITISLWDGPTQFTEIITALEDACRDDVDIQFVVDSGKTYLIYSEYEKASLFYDIPETTAFKLDLVRFEISAFPHLGMRELDNGHRIVTSVFYDGTELFPEQDYFYDYGSAVRLVQG